MRELSLNILDIAKNSTKAEASLITIEVDISKKEDFIEITISDDGKGMSEELLKRVASPFSTTRTTRKVGMGIPLFKEACEVTGGSFEITSKLGIGTTTKGNFVLSSIDRMPLGDLASTVTSLIMGDPQIDFNLKLKSDKSEFNFDTREVKEMLEESDLSSPEVIMYLNDYLKENIKKIFGGNL